MFFLINKKNWDSHHIRLKSHYKECSYKKKKKTKIKQYIGKLYRNKSKITEVN